MSYITDPLTTGLILAGVGSSISATYAIVNQILSLKYQNKLEMSKYKIQKMDKSSNGYMTLASYARAIHEVLCLSENLEKPCLYYMCKFYLHYSKIIRDFGGFELDDLDGERTIAILIADIIDLTRKNITFESVSIMSNLVTEDENYDDFVNKLKKKKVSIISDFNAFIDDKNHHQKLHDYFLWLYKLIDFEVNYAYKLWYGKEEKFILDPAFRKYLKKKQKDNLIMRLDLVGKNTLSKKTMKLKLWLLNRNWRSVHGS